MGSAREQFEPIADSGVDLLDRKRAHARGCELQRQRDAVEVSAQLGDGDNPGRGQFEVRQLSLCPLDEELHRLGTSDALFIGRWLRQRKWLQRIDLLTVDAKRFATGSDDRRL